MKGGRLSDPCSSDPQAYWCVFDREDKPILYTMDKDENSRADAWDRFFVRSQYPLPYLDWEHAYADGYRCQKVNIVGVGR